MNLTIDDYRKCLKAYEDRLADLVANARNNQWSAGELSDLVRDIGTLHEIIAQMEDDDVETEVE